MNSLIIVSVPDFRFRKSHHTTFQLHRCWIKHRTNSTVVCACTVTSLTCVCRYTGEFSTCCWGSQAATGPVEGAIHLLCTSLTQTSPTHMHTEDNIHTMCYLHMVIFKYSKLAIYQPLPIKTKQSCKHQCIKCTFTKIALKVCLFVFVVLGVYGHKMVVIKNKRINVNFFVVALSFQNNKYIHVSHIWKWVRCSQITVDYLYNKALTCKVWLWC